ncbi:hypothetical protein FB45DRAFT_1040897 [Roridomyces roridus]|uniref:Uncharacterized protein n=1 Tax=Roridomyces roridus TaxID=1738132 RepID=A0AAD7F9K5_9AGAR|nr:hypothetical protein FB45DRAFT_1040897 [Roridomyces roridus]
MSTPQSPSSLKGVKFKQWVPPDERAPRAGFFTKMVERVFGTSEERDRKKRFSKQTDEYYAVVEPRRETSRDGEGTANILQQGLALISSRRS